MKILIITEKYHSGPARLTNNMHNIVGSWECAGYGEYEHLFIDPEPGCIWSTAALDQALLTKEYDCFIISAYHIYPSREVIKKVGHRGTIIFWDSIVSMGAVRSWAEDIAVTIVDHGKGEEYPNVYAMEVPQDTRIFCRDETVVQDLDVSFVGSTNSAWPERKILLEKIKSAGINLWYGGGRGGNPEDQNLSVEDYAMIHKRSKICLNLAGGHNGKFQRKGRVAEVAECGRLLMTNHPETMCGKEGCFFGRDEFVAFDDSNVVEKIKYYLEHKEEREDIARRMQHTQTHNFGPKYFWRKILNLCGVTV